MMPRTFKEVLAEELTVKSLGLSYPFPQAFSESPWLPTPLFIAYRLVLTSCCAFLLIESIYKKPDGRWLLSYPNTAAIVTTLYFLNATAICIYCAVRDHVRIKKKQSLESARLAAEPGDDLSLIPQQGDSESTRHSYVDDSDLETSAFQPPDLESDGLSWPYKLHWTCFNMAANAMFAGTLIYFILSGSIIYELDVGMFLSLLVFMLADTLVSFVPVKLLHFVYAFIFTALHVLFVAISLAVANPEEDERVFWFFSSFPTATQAVLTCVAIIGQPIFHAIYFGLHKLRWWLIAIIYSREEGI